MHNDNLVRYLLKKNNQNKFPQWVPIRMKWKNINKYSWLENILRTVGIRVDRHIEVGDLTETGKIDSFPQLHSIWLGLSLEAITNSLPIKGGFHLWVPTSFFTTPGSIIEEK